MGDPSRGLGIWARWWVNALLQEVGSEKEEGRAGSRDTLFFFPRWRDLEFVEMPKGQRLEKGLEIRGEAASEQMRVSRVPGPVGEVGLDRRTLHPHQGREKER